MSPGSSPLNSAAPSAWSRLRLKQVFLRSLVISLTACAVVAVAALLWGTFNRTTGRILGTLAALAVHSGIAMACAETLERRQWPRLSAVGLIAFAANFWVVIAAVWWMTEPRYPDGQAVWGTIALAGFYVLAMPSADLLERGIQRAISAIALLACGVAFAMCLLCIWCGELFDDTESLFRATAVVGIVAFSLSHTTLLLRVPGSVTAAHLLRASVVCVWLLAAMGSLSILYEIEDEYWYRWFGAVGVLDACGSLALLIMAKLGRIRRIEKLQTVVPRVELRCPRCTTLQTIEAGVARCGACGLKFRIEIDEPRCAQCDYLLWQLPERRCPECGTPF